MSNFPSTTLPSLTSGILLKTSNYESGFHLDSAHVRNLSKSLPAMKLGTITPFIATGFLNNGDMYSLPGKAKQIEVDTDVFTWDTPAGTEDFHIVEVITSGDKLGIDGTSFKIRTNKRMVGNTATLKFDRFSDIELFVTNDEILQDGRTFIYTVSLLTNNGAQKWVPREFLRVGTRLIHNSSHHGEFSTVYNDILPPGGPVATYYNYVGQTRANIHYTVTDEALGMSVPTESIQNLKDYTKVIEAYIMRKDSDSFDYSQKGGNPLTGLYKGDGKRFMKDVVATAWVPAVEALGMARIDLDVEYEAIWGTGGKITLDGREYNRPIGLYHQLNRGYRHFYNIGNLEYNRLNAILSSYLKDRQLPFQSNVIEIETGMGGLNAIRQMLSKLPNQMGMIIDSDPFLQGKNAKGSNQQLHFSTPSITSIQTDIGIVKFVHQKALDPVQANDLENPMVGAYRLSSYLYIITDITGANDSLFEVKYKNGWDFKWYFENGKSDYMGRTEGFHGSNKPFGFKVFMEKRHKCYWLADPTRAFMMIPYNPFTGRPFGQGYFDSI